MPTRLIIVAALAALLLTPSRADAGTYDVYACRLPDTRPAPTDGWSAFETPGLSHGTAIANSCPVGGALSARMPLTPHSGPAEALWRFDAPAGTTIAAFEIHRTAMVGGTVDGYSAYGYAAGAGEAGPLASANAQVETCRTGGWAAPEPCISLGDYGTPLAPGNALVRSGVRETRVTFGVGCLNPLAPTAATGCLGGNSVAAEVNVHRARVTLLDEHAPDVVTPRIVQTDPGQGILRMALSASDRGAGIKNVTVLIDHESVTTEGTPSCETPYTARVPCPLDVGFVRSVRVSGLSTGKHTVQAVATDAAGNTSSSPIVEFDWVMSAAQSRDLPIVATGTSLDNRASPRTVLLRSWFAGKSRAAVRTLRYGQRAVVEGVLTDATGAAVGSTDLRVEERSAGAGITSTLRTDAKGRFSFRLGAGPSRVVEISYRAAPSDPAPVAVARVTVRVRAGVTLKTSKKRVRNGTALRFSGRVLGERGTRRAIVTIYALSSGRRARIPVETVRANSSGRFSYTYRFRSIPGPSVYRFEARVPKQTGFPYLEGASRRVTVRGRP
jgi:hypothetical protein